MSTRKNPSRLSLSRLVEIPRNPPRHHGDTAVPRDLTWLPARALQEEMAAAFLKTKGVDLMAVENEDGTLTPVRSISVGD